MTTTLIKLLEERMVRAATDLAYVIVHARDYDLIPYYNKRFKEARATLFSKRDECEEKDIGVFKI